MMRENWIEGKLEDLLNYIQPTNYIVESTAYNDNYKTPVLTAGKTFILGYTDEENNVFAALPVIIFDDFTTATKYVNFKFKVKSSAMKILAPSSEEVNVKYVYYHMQTIRHNVDTHKRYWISIFSKLNIAIAPLPEQRAIVAKIEESFSKLDSGIESLKKAKEQLEIYRQAVLKAAFEGELTKDKEKIIFVKLGNVLNIVSGKTPKGLNDVNNDGKNKFLKVSDMNLPGNEIFMKNSKLNLNDKDIIDLKIKRCPKGTVIFPKTGGAIFTNKKRILIDESSFDLNIMGILPNENYRSKYIYYFFVYQDLRKFCDGTAVPQINKKHILRLQFPSCSVIKQEEIIIEIESRLSVCDNILAIIEGSLEKAEALRQSILKKAFEGKLLSKEELEACRQEDDWEPAAELLKRIQEANKEVN
jgi:type I restriction enzyme S subunit